MRAKPYPLPEGWESIQNTPLWVLMKPLFDIEQFKWNEFALSWMTDKGLQCVFWGNTVNCNLHDAMNHYFHSKPLGAPMLMRFGQRIELDFTAVYKED